MLKKKESVFTCFKKKKKEFCKTPESILPALFYINILGVEFKTNDFKFVKIQKRQDSWTWSYTLVFCVECRSTSHWNVTVYDKLMYMWKHVSHMYVCVVFLSLSLSLSLSYYLTLNQSNPRCERWLEALFSASRLLSRMGTFPPFSFLLCCTFLFFVELPLRNQGWL